MAVDGDLGMAGKHAGTKGRALRLHSGRADTVLTIGYDLGINGKDRRHWL